uniref:Uncharacterized protein n=1 Tax=Peronospora matthiolae TaxID=2874970 RepID=A0AAV1SZ87_9STRA
MVRVTKVGTAELKTVVNGKEVIVDLTEVYYAENLADNIISYGLLEERGVFLMREGRPKLCGAPRGQQEDIRSLPPQQCPDY